MKVTAEEEQAILSLLKDIFNDKELTEERILFIDSKWDEFVYITLTYQSGFYVPILNMIVDDNNGVLNIERGIYETLYDAIENPRTLEYLDSVVDYSIDRMGA